MKYSPKKFFLILGAAALLFGVITTVSAKTAVYTIQDPSPKVAAQDNAQNNNQNANKANPGDVIKDKLAGGRLKACEEQSKNIKRRFDHTVVLANKFFDVFGDIAGRVEKYYTDKLVPKGKIVPNYNALVANIQTAKDTTKTAIDKLGTDAKNFSCTSDNPKAQVAQFRKDAQEVIKDLKAYRTAVKNLIVAVRSITGTEKSGK